MLNLFKRKKPVQQEVTTPTIDIEQLVAEASKDHQVAIVATCNVLKVLERQLADVNTDMETSVTGVCEGFRGMAQRAQSALSSAQEAMGTGTQSHQSHTLIQEIQQVLQSLVASVKLSCEFSNEMSGKLVKLESRLSSVQEGLRGVEEIANKAKLVALNGQIEAARLGEKGRGFSVVAQETKLLAASAAQTSDLIGDSLKELASELKGASAKIKERAQKDTTFFVESEKTAHGLLKDFDASHQRMLGSIGQTSEISSQLGMDIARSVMSMQFQDRVSQRIAHIISTLDGLVGHVQPACTNELAHEARKQSDRWLADLASSYTMDSERMAHSGEVTFTSTPQDSLECSVELF